MYSKPSQYANSNQKLKKNNKNTHNPTKTENKQNKPIPTHKVNLDQQIKLIDNAKTVRYNTIILSLHIHIE